MVDRIDKTGLDDKIYENYRIEGAPDSTDEERRQNSQSDDEAPTKSDDFRKNNQLLPKKEPKQTRSQLLPLLIQDIRRAWLVGVDLKTNPAKLDLQIIISPDAEIWRVRTSVSRELALKLKARPMHRTIDLPSLVQSDTLWVEFLERMVLPEDEITRISSADDSQGLDMTLSETFKVRKQGESLLHQLGVVDEKTSKLNMEVFLAYLTAVVVCVFLLGLFLYFTF